MNAVVVGTRCVLSAVKADALLRALPKGAYTTARTVRGKTAVFELNTHVARTACSAELMRAQDVLDGVDGAAEVDLSEATLRPQLLAAMRSVIAAYTAQADVTAGSLSSSPDVKLTLLLLWSRARVGDALRVCEATLPFPPGALAVERGAPLLLIAHAAPLLPRRPPPVIVQVAGSPRAHAAAKDSEWVRERTALEAARPAEVEEIILATHGSGGSGDAGSVRLLEGTQTNFFALAADGAVETAGEGDVLGGTVRRLVLEVCAREGISVRLTQPKVEDAPTWRGAFISSTSRLVMPVDELRVPAALLTRSATDDDDAVVAFRFPREVGGLATRIEELIAAEVLSHSAPLD